MADLNRQLQEYLAQSKGGSSSAVVSAPQSSSRDELDDSGPGWGAWFSKMNPFPATGTSPWAAEPEPDPWLPTGLSRWQRLVGSALCLLLAVLCFSLAALYGSLLLLRKFALLWSLGSVFALAAAGFLRGPSRLLGEPDRRGLALLYLGSVGGTLYAALGLRSTLLTTVGAAIQLVAGGAYLLASLPGGTAGLRYVGGFLTSFVRRRVSKTLPV
ncbi:vesicle transport protein SFT2C [Sphaerodactylus townsendi]|uniref:vesicle transport protein SFT2C n=1 Tax=Sphaerodactylus townsendi TaxID=933632 RepID=UPI0020268DC7|nr:vesicle transport protein SFT2C [Sphaerodactylus townsendi]XP_048338231.1 vesicle transport protein SFT2C [Sphaerodactylus townsendi]XP_048338232.1 vesicle transport protein SFT2C [Sphaerodactylus townsendi]XP_048338234.1 vesicle transport protein SFT2C [Sphaerodactylus townsendi]XP_048338235.1 vesicle transport protein SFT2C [Sphaerodactylus townsendi]XP_048338236.1 vesicle transport protein SFT2C [Sphaerodactylus townsendi]